MAAITPSDVSSRSLKNALQDQFPQVKSAHLTEAIARALGFNTHAALLAGVAVNPNQIITFNEAAFYLRLQELKYSIDSGLSLDAVPQLKSSENQFIVERLRQLEEKPAPHWDEIYALRRRCAELVAQEFDLGYLLPEEDKNVIHRWDVGIDYSTCQPGWGRLINTNSSVVKFPGSDHRWRFYKRLPLSNGKYVEYCNAVASMPYLERDGSIPMIEEAREYAKKIGWSCSVHTDKSWYSVGRTTLVLFQRTTLHAEMLKMWGTSFKRWLIENQASILKGMRAPKRYVVTDIVECKSFPLDVRSFDECRGRYLKEYAPRFLYDEKDVMLKTFISLFGRWQDELASSELATHRKSE